MTGLATDFLIPFFMSHEHITGIKLGYNKLNSSIGINLRQIINTNNLVVLDVRNTNIGANGTYGIFEGLEYNSTLIELIINGNPINKNGIKLLTKILMNNTTLQRLGLRFCDIAKAGFMDLTKAIEINPSLIYLDISHNSLESLEACRKLGEAIGHIKSKKTDNISKTVINELNISGCLIGHKQIEELTEGLYRNRTVKTLHIDDNDLSGKGIRALAICVQQNEAIKILTVQETELDTQDLVLFMEKLGDSNYLDVFDCRNNPGIDPSSENLIRARKR